MNREAPEQEAESSLLEHLIELRTRLVRGLMGVGAMLLVLLPFVRPLYDRLALPLVSQLPAGQIAPMIASDPTSGFFAPIKLAFFAALFLSSPWLLYQAWSFVAPGLYKHEKRLAVPLLVSAIVLFYAGCAFAYFLVLPGVFHALTVFTPDIVTIAPDPAKYLDFVMVIFLAFGVSFELPVALVIMVLLGWVTPRQLREARGYAVVGVFVIAALITPPDVVSQLMLAIPMCLLYEAGILVAGWLKKPGENENESPDPR
ncbi:twin-arginine translocase subunit TatC [Pseudoxanthomonas putridarboris]|uniref:Sec-independent protein translocase protein TatC n=1 Tax=Pseudoxanthomonas putridarboris TaxID=752605 RepID=A0ABU9J566_9GAMM